ncbi:MAG: hypothetical protein ACRD36_06815, partial [Candidatus Acidiferrum sp.]
MGHKKNRDAESLGDACHCVSFHAGPAISDVLTVHGSQTCRALSAVNLVGQGFAVTRPALLEVEMD